MVSDTPRRVCLRAEIRAGGQVTIAHTSEVSTRGVVVVGDPIGVAGDRVMVKLSLPPHVTPLLFHGSVVEQAGSGAPGDPETVRIDFAEVSAETARGLADVLGRLDNGLDATRGDSVYRVLIVDDCEIMRELFSYGVRKYFRRWGGNVVIDGATDGREAWHLLERETYHLAVINRYLPVLDGARLAERIRAHPDLADMLVVGVSGEDRDDADAMLLAGVDLFLAKPIVLRDVFTTLDRLAGPRGAAHAPQGGG